MKINVVILSGSPRVTSPTRLAALSLSSRVLCDPTCGSQVFRNMVEEEERRDDETHEIEAVMYEENVPVDSFRRFIEFQEKFIADPIADILDARKDETLPKWAVRFFTSMPPKALLSLAILANYLDSPFIKNVCLVRVIQIVHNLKEEEVENTFEVPENMRLNADEKQQLIHTLEPKIISLSHQ